jgi:hypothetical protein
MLRDFTSKSVSHGITPQKKIQDRSTGLESYHLCILIFDIGGGLHGVHAPPPPGRERDADYSSGSELDATLNPVYTAMP